MPFSNTIVAQWHGTTGVGRALWLAADENLAGGSQPPIKVPKSLVGGDIHESFVAKDAPRAGALCIVSVRSPVASSLATRLPKIATSDSLFDISLYSKDFGSW
jgi:hypothetical protein